MDNANGLGRVKAMTDDNRFDRAKELRAQGRHVFGYVCCFVPLEMLTALDIVPIRLLGDPNEPQTEADKHLENIMCSFIRSVFDIDIKGRFSFLDGLVVPHSCDSVCMTWGLWPYYNDSRAFKYFLNVPHVVNEVGEELMAGSLIDFKKKLEEFTGKELCDSNLRKAIVLHNRQRALLRTLYEYRKEDCPRVSGTEVKQVLIAVMSLPVTEGNTLLEEVLSDIKARPVAKAKYPRIMVYGPAMDNDFIDLVEECGAEVVIDDACLGTRFFMADVKEKTEPYLALNHRYLAESKCPRTYRRPGEGTLSPGQTYDYDEDIELRLGHISDYAKKWNAAGAILYVIRFCDSHGFDIPDVSDSLKKNGFPVLVLEGDYTLMKAQLKTRIQAFLEILDQ
jgi:bzd-type benzoyl-CoA reductase N subunit